MSETAEKKDDYKKFYEQFVECMKLGIHENSVDDFEIAELLRFYTSKSGNEQISLKEYIDRMKEGQNDIYYITGEILIPECLNFIKGIVDSEDPPLNTSRETMQQNKILRVIMKNLVKKSREMFAEIAEKKDDYKKFYEQFVECMKLGIHENSVDDFEIAELLRFNTSKSGDEQINQLEGVHRSHEGGPERHLLHHWREHCRCVLDPVDEHTVQQVKKFDGKKLKSTTMEGLDIGEGMRRKT